MAMRQGLFFDIGARNRASGPVKQVTGDIDRLGVVTGKTNLANKRFGNILGGSTYRRQVQQAGMQISDFAVQVAGGQSAILAFTQNFPQFIQNFGAVGGIAAAVVTILGTMAFAASRAAGSVKSFGDELDETNESLDKYLDLLSSVSETQASFITGIREAGRASSEEFQDILAIEKFKALEQITQLSIALSKSAMNAKWLKGQLEEAGKLLGSSAGDILAAQMGGAAGRDLRIFYKYLHDLRNAGTLDEQYEVAVKLRDMFKDTVGPISDMTDQQREFLQQLSQTIQKMEVFVEVENEISKVNRARAEYQQSRIAGAWLAAREEQAALEAVFDAHAQYVTSRIAGEFLVARQTRQAQQNAIDAHREYVASRVTGDYLAARDAQAALDRTVSAHREYVSSRITAEWMLRREEQEAIASSQRAHAQYVTSRITGARLAAAEEIKAFAAVQAALMPQRQYSGRGSGSEYFGTSDYWNQLGYQSVADLIKELSEKPEFDVLDDLNKQLELERSLIGATSARIRVMMALGQESAKYTDQQINAAVKLAEAYEVEKQQLDEILGRTQSISDTLQNGLTNAFMSVLDRTKTFGEKMRAILGEVIAELWRIQVVKRIVGGFDAATGRGSGIIGAMSGMFGTGGGLFSGIPFFNGGGGTGSGPRAGGLDGKGGFLAMMHPKERVDDMTTGGAGGNVTVIQNNTFEAGADESSIRAILPTMVNATMAAIEDANRRRVGGLPA